MTEQTTANGIGWFEIGSAQPDAAQEFYGGLFGWAFEPDRSGDVDYRIITTGPGQALRGGIMNTGGQPGYAMFVVQVEDVPGTCKEVERLGGRVDAGPFTNESGLAAAYLSDPEGNRFGIFTPPAAAG